jgi:hypothetical protein
MKPIPMKVLAALTLGTLSCGGVGTSQKTARDQATTVTCQRYSECQNGFGAAPAHAYTSLDSCEVDWRAKWENYWPAAACDGKIDPAALSTCLSRISSTDCMNGLDILNTILVVCPKEKVCGAGADGGTD